MTLWLTSDLHFGHENIIRYCDRPFADVDEMDAELVRRWNERVAPDDVVWVLGDVALGPIHRSLGLVAELAGDKRLVSGNHDRCWPGNKHPERWMEPYRDAGFSEIVTEHRDRPGRGPGAPGLPLPVPGRLARRRPVHPLPPGRRRRLAAARPRPRALEGRRPPDQRRLRRLGLRPRRRRHPPRLIVAGGPATS